MNSPSPAHTATQDEAQTKERPIIFSGEMVKAILEGRKSQTRRVLNPQPVFKGNHWRLEGYEGRGGNRHQVLSCPFNPEKYARPESRGWFAGSGCPYGRVGDHLWVREAFTIYNADEGTGGCLYRADLTPEQEADERSVRRAAPELCREYADYAWHSPIHMPRWASRLLLEITEIKIERLTELTEAAAVAEGVGAMGGAIIKSEQFGGNMPAAVYQFAAGWNLLNAKRGFSWDSNPWVWAITFKVISPATGESV